MADDLEKFNPEPSPAEMGDDSPSVSELEAHISDLPRGITRASALRLFAARLVRETDDSEVGTEGPSRIMERAAATTLAQLRGGR